MFLFYEGKDKKKEEYLEKARRQSVSVRRRISVAVFIVQPWRGNLEDTSGRIYFRPYVRTRAQSRERERAKVRVRLREPQSRLVAHRSIDRRGLFLFARKETWNEGRKEGISSFRTRNEGRKEEMLNLGIWNDGRKEKRGLEFTNLER